MTPETVLEMLAGAGFAFGIFKLWRRESRADVTWSIVTGDPVVSRYSSVRVQVNPGRVNSALLKAGFVGNEFSVGTHSFSVGPALPGRRAFSYCFEGRDTEMITSHETFGLFRDRDCIVLSGTYAGEPIRLAIWSEGQLAEMWTARASCGVRTGSQPPAG